MLLSIFNSLLVLLQFADARAYIEDARFPFVLDYGWHDRLSAQQIKNENVGAC